MHDIGWILVKDQPLPEENRKTVMVLFDKPRKNTGSYFGMYTSLKTSNGFTATMDGRFIHDCDVNIIAWRDTVKDIESFLSHFGEELEECVYEELSGSGV